MNQRVANVLCSSLALIVTGGTAWIALDAFASRKRPISVPVQTLEAAPVNRDASPSSTVALVVPTATSSTPDATAMNLYWLTKINALRAQKQLRELTLDPRLIETATEWATHMGTTGVLGHDRPNGQTVHEWIAERGLAFTVRDSPGGWHSNYFTENIGRANADMTAAGIDAAMDRVLADMLSEGPDGPHYRTIYHPDWNRFGAGFFFVPLPDQRVQIYMAFHYASLQ